MPRTFKDTLARDAAIFTEVNKFGETGTYLPAGGGSSRSVAVVLDEEVRIEPGPNGRGLIAVETLLVFVSRDPEAGIDQIELGAGFQREDDERVFAYTGEKQDVDEAAWTLRFERRRPHQVGGKNLR